jgi:threonine/homoserine/homoserine lactone efflux protein
LGGQAAGRGYLLWLAWKLSARRPRWRRADESKLSVGFWQGVSLQFVNIKAWMLALTLTAGWVVNAPASPTPIPWSGWPSSAPVMAVFAFTSNFTYALAGSLLRHWLRKGARLLWFNRAMALVLVATAAGCCAYERRGTQGHLARTARGSRSSP